MLSLCRIRGGIHIEEYNSIIRNVVKENECNLIDLYSYKTPYDSLDGSHPTSDGMDTIAKILSFLMFPLFMPLYTF